MRIGVLRAAASGALERALYARPFAPPDPIDPAELDALVLLDRPGHLAAASIARLSARGAPVLGLGDGFAALCALGLLEGAVNPAQLIRSHEYVRVEGQPTPVTAHLAAGSILRATTGPRVYVHDRPDALEARDLVLLRWCDEAGGSAAAEPGGNIAGVCNDDGNVVGLLPRFDRAYDEDAAAAGRRFFDSLRAHLADHR